MKAYLQLVILFILLFSSCSNDDTKAVSITPEEQNFSEELFFSEYIEGTSFNKALEIVNLTSIAIDLESEGFSIKKQSNGSGNWMSDLPLTGILNPGEVFVIANELADEPKISNNADQLKTGAPMDFNGNDPVGLFKNDVLIDVIGSIDVAEDFAKDINLRRKAGILEPSNIFMEEDWNTFDMGNTEDLGKY